MTHTASHEPHAHNHDASQNAFNDPGILAKKFDGPERDAWQKPDEVIRLLNLPNNATVLEIGAGTGYFTVRLAKHLKNGTVIATDSSPQMVQHLKERAPSAGLTNVEVRLAEHGELPPLKEKVDLILCVDAYHHIANRTAYFSHLAQYLNPQDSIAIIDRPDDSPDAPPPGHRTPLALVKKEMTQAGLALSAEHPLLLPHQFFLVFRR